MKIIMGFRVLYPSSMFLIAHLALGAGVEEILKLQDQLPKAVCDSQSVEKAPTLLEESDETPRYVILDAEASVREILSCLATADHPCFEASSGKKAESSTRKTAIEICQLLVKPGGKKRALELFPKFFLAGKLVSSRQLFLDPHFKHRKSAGLGLVDYETRGSGENKRYYLPGWVLGSELRFAMTKTLLIRKVVHPTTNGTEFVIGHFVQNLKKGYRLPEVLFSRQNIGTSDLEVTRAVLSKLFDLEAMMILNEAKANVNLKTKLSALKALVAKSNLDWVDADKNGVDVQEIKQTGWNVGFLKKSAAVNKKYGELIPVP